jgi:hypothetical protein
MNAFAARLGLALAIACLAALSAAARAQVAPNCVELCDVTCIKPWSIPDRWDDSTPIAGYAGGVKNPNWRGNGRYDQEAFTDANANLAYDAGETFLDGNGNGVHDAELYSPSITGYSAAPDAGNGNATDGDLGRELTLTITSSAAPVPGQYIAFDLPPANRGTPITGSDEYRANMADCNPSAVGAGDQLQLEPGLLSGPTNQAMRDLIAQDPNAYWDSITMSVQGSAFARSPRVVFLPAHDPVVAVSSGSSRIVVRRILAFFMEQMTGNAEVRGRFLRVSDSGLGSSCAGQPSIGGFVIACATPATPMTWGRVKGIYR